MPGKDRKSKGKKVSHRPQRAKNAYWDETEHKWYQRKDPDV